MNQLVVTTASAAAKQEVGSTAWVVLEHLVLESDARLVTEATARSVAADVSVSKDTAAAALRRLEVAGFVERLDQERLAGRFGSRRVQIYLPAGIGVLSPSPSPRSQPTIKGRPAVVEPVEQLSLLNSPAPAPAESSARPGAAHPSPGPDRRARHEFASSDAGRTRDRVSESGEASSC